MVGVSDPHSNGNTTVVGIANSWLMKLYACPAYIYRLDKCLLWFCCAPQMLFKLVPPLEPILTNAGHPWVCISCHLPCSSSLCCVLSLHFSSSLSMRLSQRPSRVIGYLTWTVIPEPSIISEAIIAYQTDGTANISYLLSPNLCSWAFHPQSLTENSRSATAPCVLTATICQLCSRTGLARYTSIPWWAIPRMGRRRIGRRPRSTSGMQRSLSRRKFSISAWEIRGDLLVGSSIDLEALWDLRSRRYKVPG